MAKAVGIDLRTTNSVVGVREEGKSTVIPNSEGLRLTPSVVGYTEDGLIPVGQVARIVGPGFKMASDLRHP